MNQRLNLCPLTKPLLSSLSALVISALVISALVISEVGNAKSYITMIEIDSTKEKFSSLAEAEQQTKAAGSLNPKRRNSKAGVESDFFDAASRGKELSKQNIRKDELPPRFLDKRGYFLLPTLVDDPNPMILVILPGAQKRPLEYAHLAEAIQRKSKVSLWIGIAKFTGNIPNPMEARGAVNNLIANLKKDGIPTASLANTYLAGHSMGGIIGQKMVENEDYRGLILFSSYLTRKNGASALIDFPKPVLTLNGDLDGLTRVTRISLDREAWEVIAEKEGEKEAASSKPVMVLSGVNHSQFASEELVKGDLLPEISYLSAQEQIAQISADFILANGASTASGPETRDDAVLRLLSAQEATKSFLSNFENSKKDQTIWCENAQQTLSTLMTAGSKIRVKRNILTEKRLFGLSSPTIALKEDGILEVTIPSFESRTSNPLDLSLVAEASPDIACKLYVPKQASNSLGGIDLRAPDLGKGEFLQDEKRKTSEFEPLDNLCSSINRSMYDQVLALMPDSVKIRYSRRGKSLLMVEDLSIDSESRWQNSSLRVSQNQSDLRSFTVESPVWATWEEQIEPRLEGTLEVSESYGKEGLRLNCKLLSPSRIAEWIMLEGLKN